MPVTAFTSRVKNAGKRKDECGDRGVEEKKASSTIIYNLLHGWLMYVCPQMRNIYSSTCLRIQSTFFNETNTLQQALEPQTQAHLVSGACVLPVYCTLTRHPGAETHIWTPKRCMYVKEQTKTKKKSCSQTALSFNQWEVQNYACKKTEMLKSKITLCNIPGH